MEGELWSTVYHVVLEEGKKRMRRKVSYPDTTVVLTFLYSCWQDRPRSWACRAGNWATRCRPRKLPSESTMSRRLRTASVHALLEAVEQDLRAGFGESWCKWIDAMPLPVGGASRDRQAGVGYGAGQMAKGYKLYAICDGHDALDAWEVWPMNVHEKSVARHLIVALDGQEGYLVGDRMYDANSLYALSSQMGFQLVTPKAYPGGLGHRRQNVHRLRGLALASRPFGRRLLRDRFAVDRHFGQMGNFGGGLNPLPHWVRGLMRVRLWVQGKVILDTARRWLAKHPRTA